MKLLCNGLDLHDAVSKVGKAVSTHTELKILEGIKLSAYNDTLVLTATNNEISIEKRIRAAVSAEGDTVVPGRFFQSLTAKMGDEQISLSSQGGDGGVLRIEFKDVQSDLACMSADEFPPFKTLGGTDGFEISQRVFKELINRVYFSVSASKDERPILRGVCMEIADKQLTAVSLDGFRLSHAVAPLLSGDSQITAVVPGKSLEEIGKLLDNSDEPVTFYLQHNFMMAAFPDMKFTSRILDGNFVPYKQIIPKAFATEVICAKAQLMDCVDLSNIFAAGSTLAPRVDMDIRDNNIYTKTLNEQGEMNNRAPAKITGKDIAISFNIRYILDALKATSDEFVKISLNTPSSPCVIAPVESEYPYLFLILPLYGRQK
ncbi:MAG: DNA polymerase III subunit beta [Firmicutes bacterium]|nr:DNA polymerase III subunit beta [Bacillota bacterium]